MIVSDPPTQEERDKYGEHYLHIDGTCPHCSYDMVRADDAFDEGKADTNYVWKVHFIEVMTDSREVATQDNATGESNSTIIFCKSKCINCGLAGESSFMGPRTLNDIARKQVEFLWLDYEKSGAT
jgi:hypothetical protein